MKTPIWKTAKEFFESDLGTITSVIEKRTPNSINSKESHFSKVMIRNIEGVSYEVELKESITSIPKASEPADRLFGEYSERWWKGSVVHRDGYPAIISSDEYTKREGKKPENYSFSESKMITGGETDSIEKFVDESLLTRTLWLKTEAGPVLASANVAKVVDLSLDNELNDEVKPSEKDGYNVGPYYHELCNSIIEKLPDSVNIVFDIPEDEFLSEMWEYAEVYFDVVDKAYLRDGGLPGVAVYETPDDVAKLFVHRSKVKGEMITPDEFRTAVEKVIDRWTGLEKNKVPLEEMNL